MCPEILQTYFTYRVVLSIAINRAEHVCAIVDFNAYVQSYDRHKYSGVFIKQYQTCACHDLYLTSRAMISCEIGLLALSQEHHIVITHFTNNAEIHCVPYDLISSSINSK